MDIKFQSKKKYSSQFLLNRSDKKVKKTMYNLAHKIRLQKRKLIKSVHNHTAQMKIMLGDGLIYYLHKANNSVYTEMDLSSKIQREQASLGTFAVVANLIVRRTVDEIKVIRQGL